jgi:hypothetical protein
LVRIRRQRVRPGRRARRTTGGGAPTPPGRRAVAIRPPVDDRVARRRRRPRPGCAHDGSCGMDGGDDPCCPSRRWRRRRLDLGTGLPTLCAAGTGLGIPRPPQHRTHRPHQAVPGVRIRLPRHDEERHPSLVLDGGVRHSGKGAALRREARRPIGVFRALTRAGRCRSDESALICLPPNGGLR